MKGTGEAESLALIFHTRQWRDQAKKSCTGREIRRHMGQRCRREPQVSHTTAWPQAGYTMRGALPSQHTTHFHSEDSGASVGSGLPAAIACCRRHSRTSCTPLSCSVLRLTDALGVMEVAYG